MQVVLAEHDGFGGAQGGVVQAGVEALQVRAPVRQAPTATSRDRACAGLTTTRRSTLAATPGAVHWTRSTGLEGRWPCSTA